jgi:hypothetical protein
VSVRSHARFNGIFSAEAAQRRGRDEIDDQVYWDIAANMLREFVHVKQERHGGRRRWFESDGFDLVVWNSPMGEVEGFQMCYDLGQGERALTWKPKVGFVHNAVDTGENPAGSGGKLTPILVRDGEVPWERLVARFAERGAALEEGLRELVAERLAARQ